MSGVFMDGGGGDSSSFGGDGGDHGGHGGHGAPHGHGQGGHNFLSQILGLDQQDHAHLANHGGEGAEGQAPSQTPAWNSALQGLKLENLIAGINITPNFLLFMLFASFVGWLGVIYWIRHHEPFANQVLGSSAAFAPTVGADRKIINECRDANPLKTSAQSGIVYSPQPTQNSSPPPAGSQVNASLSAAMSSAFGQSPSANTAAPAPTQSSAGSQRMAATQYSAPTQSSAPGPTYAAVPEANSPVNQGLSAAMASALGPSTGQIQGQAAGQASPAPADPAGSAASAYQPNYAPGYSQAPAPYPMADQMMPQSMPMSAAGGPAAAGGNMRLFSSRQPSMPQSAPMAAAAGGGGMRLFSSRRSMTASAPGGVAPGMAQAQAEAAQNSQAAMSSAPAPPAPQVENANTWSLANQGSGTFSADTAQFSSQFGAPLDAPNPAPAAGLGSGSYGVSSPEGTRQKVVTDK